MARGKTIEKAKILERQLKALELRKDGYSFRAIGERLGINHTQAFRDVHQELTRLADENRGKAEELRQLDLERLDQMAMALMRLANVGNPGAINSMLKIMERRAKLLGLDMPTRFSIEGGVELATINQMIKALQEIGEDPSASFNGIIEYAVAKKAQVNNG